MNICWENNWEQAKQEWTNEIFLHNLASASLSRSTPLWIQWLLPSVPPAVHSFWTPICAGNREVKKTIENFIREDEQLTVESSLNKEMHRWVHESYSS